MTRHLCAAVSEAAPFVAAGAEAVPTMARTARPATTPTAASRRVERKLRRICGPFSPGVGRLGRGWARRPVNASGTVTTVGWRKSRGGYGLVAILDRKSSRNMLQWTYGGARALPGDDPRGRGRGRRVDRHR